MTAGPAREQVDWIDESDRVLGVVDRTRMRDRKSTRLNSSHT